MVKLTYNRIVNKCFSLLRKSISEYLSKVYLIENQINVSKIFSSSFIALIVLIKFVSFLKTYGKTDTCLF